MHKWLLQNVIKAPMFFFDTTPLGRVLARFPSDVQTVDVLLPTLMESMLYMGLSVNQFKATGTFSVLDFFFRFNCWDYLFQQLLSPCLIQCRTFGPCGPRLICSSGCSRVSFVHRVASSSKRPRDGCWLASQKTLKPLTWWCPSFWLGSPSASMR